GNGLGAHELEETFLRQVPKGVTYRVGEVGGGSLALRSVGVVHGKARARRRISGREHGCERPRARGRPGAGSALVGSSGPGVCDPRLLRTRVAGSTDLHPRPLDYQGNPDALTVPCYECYSRSRPLGSSRPFRTPEGLSAPRSRARLGGRARARSQGEDRPSGPTSFASPESRLCSERSHFPVYQRGDDDGSDDELGARDPGHSGTGPVPPPPRGRRDGQRGRDAARDRAHPRAAPLLALAGSGPGGRPYAERRRARTPASSLGRTTPL